MVPVALEILPTCALSADANVPGPTSGRHLRNETRNSPATSPQSADELPGGQTEAELQSACRQPCAIERTPDRKTGMFK